MKEGADGVAIHSLEITLGVVEVLLGIVGCSGIIR